MKRVKNLKKHLRRLREGTFLLSPYPSIQFENTPQSSETCIFNKPNGLWYSVGDGWFRVVLDRTNRLYRYLYRIDIDLTDMMVIRNEKDIIEFTKIFGSPSSGYPFDEFGISDAIDWKMVAKTYTGIEIAPYIHSNSIRMNWVWYYGWDVASGCIWDKAAFKGVELISDLDE